MHVVRSCCCCCCCCCVVSAARSKKKKGGTGPGDKKVAGQTSVSKTDSKKADTDAVSEGTEYVFYNDDIAANIVMMLGDVLDCISSELD